MNKQEFLSALRKGLSGLPQEDIEGRLTFYDEMIEDRIEEGLSEEEAVAAAGSVDDIAAQTVADIPLSKLAKERILPKRGIKAWELLLLVLGSPIWLSLAIAAAAVVLAVYVTLWAVIISLWAVFAALAAAAVGSVPVYVVFIAGSSSASAFAMLSAGLVCAGLAIFMFFGSKEAAKGIAAFTRRITVWIKNRFIKKEAA